MGLTPTLAAPEVKEVTLSLFGGRKTDMAPADLPEGLSPDTEDGIYLPGEWQSRPALQRLFGPGQVLPAGTSVLYEKTYIQPNDNPLTLILTSDGKLWVEDITNSPLVPTQLGAFTPGLYAQSVTEFGREYIAFSDLLHGQGVPLQFDGTNLDRVTMDGPGAPPQAVDIVQSVAIVASPNGLQQVSNQAIIAISEVGFVVTVTLGAPASPAFAYQVGDLILIAGVATAGYNGNFTVTAVQPQGLHVLVSYRSTILGLAADSTGTAQPGLVEVTTTVNNAFFAGESVTIAGAGVGGYNGTWVVRGTLSATQFTILTGTFALANSGGGTAAIAGLVSPGTHQLVVMFLTRQGYITRPSPVFSWTSVGNVPITVVNIPLGPANVIARILAFTGAGGDNFFFIPETVSLPNPSGPPTVVQSTVLRDNLASAVTLSFSDTALFAGIAIDQIGNDLFDQVMLGPVMGFFGYASRLACWGDYNKIENFLNMGFCGGYLPLALVNPLGWNSAANAGGTLVNGGPWAAGMSWQITGDGSGNQKGMLSQSAFLDSFGNAIISPSTAYTLRFWAQVSAANLAGNLFVVLSSASTNFSAQVQVPISTLSVAGAFTPLKNFSAVMPAVIPSDLLLSIYQIGLNAGATLTISELEIIFQTNPFRDHFSRWSYVTNPEAFAETTGQLGPDDDASPIRCFALLKETSLLETAEGVHRFTDNNQEPDEWVVQQETRAIGALSMKAGDPGKFGTGDAAEDWALIASRNGVYLFAGGEFWKVSQEISRGATPQTQDPRKCWDDINWAAAQTIVAKNDPSARRAYFAVPINGALTPNCVFVLDYREMDTATQIANAPPLHITITGKMRSSDLTRKWSVWNVAANDLEILVRPQNVRQLFFAGGAFPAGKAFANIYSLNQAMYTDDDYGQLAPFYDTYAFMDHEQEIVLGLGAGRKLCKAVHAFAAGIGLITITPIINSLYNFQPPLSPRILSLDTDQSNFLAEDLEWTTAIRGQRMFFRISVQPLPGATDVKISLQKFIAWMMKDPVAPFRQSMV